MTDDDNGWKPHKVNGPEDEDRDDKNKTTMVLLPIPDKLKEQGIKGIAFLGSALTIEYKDKTILSTLYRDDPVKTMMMFDKMVNGTLDESLKRDIKAVLAENWLKHILTEEEISRAALGAASSKAAAVLQRAKKHCQQVFIDEYKVPFAAVMINEHLEVIPIYSRRFKNWLRKTLHLEDDIMIGSQVIEDVVDMLTADADFDGDSRNLGLRITANANNWYYDLCNKPWECIEITSENWSTISNAVLFRRFSHQKEQEYPAQGYPSDIFDQFMNLLNVKEENRLLLKCYIVSLFIPNLPKVVLMIHGGQGTAKSMLQELIKMLVDPSQVRTLSFPRDMAQLVQQLYHHPIAYYDNLSRIPEWISDLLCRAVTESGFSKRELYTNDDDVIYTILRAIGFNGINLAATKADLLDRGLIIQTDTIEDENRRKKEDIWKEFCRIRPQLLGYIMDILVKVLKWKRDNPNLKLIQKLPRMADWAEICEIISRCMNEEDDAFIKSYRQNIDLQAEEVIEGSDLAIVIRSFVESDNRFNGTATALLTELERVAGVLGVNTRNRYWPKGASSLSHKLNTLKRSLQEIGIVIESYKSPDKSRTRFIRLFAKGRPRRPRRPKTYKNRARNKPDGRLDASDDVLQKLVNSEPPQRPEGYVKDSN